MSVLIIAEPTTGAVKPATLTTVGAAAKLEGDLHVLVPATTFGKNVMPRVAALLDVAQLSEIVAVDSADTFQRPIYAGNAIATVQSPDPIKVITVRGTAFEAAAAEGGSAAVELLSAFPDAATSKFVSQELS